MWILFIIIGVVLVLVDQITKHLAVQYLAEGAVARGIPNLFNFIYVENRGAAFGMLQDTRWFLVVFTLMLMVVVILYTIKQERKTVLLLSAATLIVAGGIGNMIDRVLQGYVVDFIHLLFMDFPCFNFADMCVCVGAVLLAIYILITGDTKRSSDEDVGNL